MTSAIVRELTRYRPAYIVLLLALPAAFLFWNYLRLQDHENTRLALSREVELVRDEIERRFDLYGDVLYGLRALYAVNGAVSRAQFKRYIDAMAASRLRGVHNIQFVRYVPGGEREAFEARVRAQGNPAGEAFTITPPGNRPNYYVVEYVEPYSGNERALGYDIASLPANGAVVEETRDRGELTGSRRLAPAQGGGPRWDYALRLPIFRTGVDIGNPKDRQRALVGFVVVAFHVESLTLSLLQKSFFKNFDLAISDTGYANSVQQAAAADSLLFDSRGLKTPDGPLAPYARDPPGKNDAITAPVNVAGRRWLLAFKPTASNAIGHGTMYPDLFLAAALLISGLLFWAMRASAVARARTKDIAQSLTSELRESESRYRNLTMVAPVGIFHADHRGYCFYVNQTWSGITGVPTSAALGQNWRSTIHPDDMKKLDEMWAHGLDGVETMREKYRIVRPDGAIVWVFGQALIERDAAGKITGFIGAITDITELHDVQRELEHAVALFRAAMNATHDGILVTDMEGNLQNYNRKFVALLGIDEEYIKTHDRKHRVAHIASKMRDPKKFIAQAEKMLAVPDAESQEIVELANGQVLECYTAPQRVDGNQVGRVWSLRDVTATVRFEAAQRRQLRFRGELIEVIPNPVYVKDLEGRYIGVNRAWEALFGQRTKWLGKTLQQLEPGEAAEWRPRELEVMAAGGSSKFELRTTDDGGAVHDMIDNMSVYTDDSGATAGIIGVLTDITERKRTETMLRESEEKFRLITENVGDLVALLDASGKRIYNSPSYQRIFGSSPLKEDSFIDIHPDDRDRIRQLFRDTVESGKGRMDEFRFIQADGSIRYIESQGNVIRDDAGKVTKVIVVSRDVTERKQNEERIRHLAQHDALTNLPNRVLLLDRIKQAIVRAQRGHLQVAVFFLDLDRFKIINDSLGHQVGDQVLLAVAKRLTDTLRETDTVARLGGDEFVVLLSDVTGADSVSNVARKALEAVAAPITYEQQELQVTGSLGIALFPQDGSDAETLMRKADTAMYHAKASGRNNCQFFTGEMNAAVQQRLVLERGLRLALARNEFQLAYQPQVDLRTGEVVAVEALLRWHHPRDGVVLPGEFIRVAEEIGLIIPLGEWVLRAACEQHRRWQLAGKRLVRMAVNLSARQFTQKNLADIIRQVLAETGMEAKYLELEITETEMMQHASETIASLHDIYAMGVRVTIDDFGTGYSSLSYLKQLPIDRVKIDKSFVRDIHTDPDDAAIVAAIIAMGHVLKLSVVAEGVESDSQLAFLRLQGCDEAQGYFITRPTTPEAVGRLLGARLIPAMVNEERSSN